MYNILCKKNKYVEIYKIKIRFFCKESYETNDKKKYWFFFCRIFGSFSQISSKLLRISKNDVSKVPS